MPGPHLSAKTLLSFLDLSRSNRRSGVKGKATKEGTLHKYILSCCEGQRRADSQILHQTAVIQKVNM